MFKIDILEMMWLPMMTMDVVARNRVVISCSRGNDLWKTSRNPEDKVFEDLCQQILMLHVFGLEELVLGPRSASYRLYNPFSQL